MSGETNTLAERRQALVQRSDQERAELATIFGGLERKLAIVDTVVATARRLNRHRLLVGAAGAFLVLAPLAARSWIRRAVSLVPLALEGYRLVKAGKSRHASS